MNENTDEVLALEKRFWTEADNPDLFRETFAEEGIFAGEPMGFIGKQQAMAMTAEEPWTEVEMSDVHVVQLTPDVVILAYHGQGRHEGNEEPYRGNIASTYVRRDGRWLLALTAHQPQKTEAGG